MIDFARCVLRKDGQDDTEWRKLKAWQDEEGAIGVVMEGKLRKTAGGGFYYELSAQAVRLREEFMRAEVFESQIEYLT